MVHQDTQCVYTADRGLQTIDLEPEEGDEGWDDDPWTDDDDLD
jgi:hypothetical protein